MALLLEQMGSDSGIDSSAKSDDDALCGHKPAIIPVLSPSSSADVAQGTTVEPGGHNHSEVLMDLQLAERTALVTGASTGIGRGIALSLAAEGVQLAVSARRAEMLETLAAEVLAAGGKPPIVLCADLYAADAAQTLAAAALAALGRVDILVNNAGGSRSFKELHVDEQRWQEAMTLNFHRPRQLTDALIDQM
ncbi:MAG: SDR family NAD(P)-dependent oxidoreductase, partial [Rhodoferax sp.]